MRTLATLLCPLLASMAFCTAAADAAPKEVYLGDVASPRAALNGKTFKLKAGQRLRFTNLQRRKPGATSWQLLYFYEMTATPKGALYHGAMALGDTRDTHYRQETFSVLKKARVGTVIEVRTGCQYSADWALSFKIKVVP